MVELPIPDLKAGFLDAIPVLSDEALFSACGVRLAFTGRGGGVSADPYASLNIADHVGDDPSCVSENRHRVLAALGGQGSPLIVPNQVHGENVVTVESSDDACRAGDLAREGADVVAVGAAGVAVLMNFADCLPLIMVSPTGRFCIAHAGWRGAVAGVASKAVDALQHLDAGLGVAPAQYNAYIGPHICERCFEVGPEVAEQFEQRFGRDALPDERHVCLSKAVSVDLGRAGVDPRRIACADACTQCDSDAYFSYRASGGTCGRNAAAALRIDGMKATG